MKKIILLCLFFLPALMLAQTSIPQNWPDSTKNVLVKLKDGTSINGKIVAHDDAQTSVKTINLGIVKVATNNIESFKEITGFYRNGSFWFDNPHTSRYFFAPSAYNLKKGEAYYQNAYLFVNSVNYGVNDNFSMGAGFVLNPSFRDWQLFFFTPKFSVQAAPKLRFGGGAIVITYFGRKYIYDPVTFVQKNNGIRTEAVGILYANSTIGSPEHNFTAGLGWGFGNGELRSTPVLNLNFMTRVHKNVSIVSENWFATNPNGSESVGLMSGGVRIFGERISVDISGVAPVFSGFNDGFILIPYVDFVYKFGRK